MKKVCSKCKIEKDVTEFSKDKTKKSGFRNSCKECSNAYYKNNKERFKLYNERNKEKRKEYDKEYYKKNMRKSKERSNEYYKANTERCKEQKRLYFQTEAGKEAKVRGIHKRRAKKKEVDKLGVYTSKEWKDCLTFFNDCDAYTGEPLEGDVTIDHITPISKGGTNNINNLVPCKKAINSSKHANLIDEWYPKQPFYSKKRHNKIKEWVRIKSQINLFEL